MSKSNMIFKKSALSSAILCAMGSVHSATITVDANCTLSEAMQTANSDLPVGSCVVGNGDDTIQVVTENNSITISTVFQSSVNGPGNVGLPVVTGNLIIEGNGLTIRANNNTDNFRLFEVGSGADLTLRDTIVTNADDGFGIGSGLFTYGGRVSIENSTFALNNGAVFIGNSFGNEITNSIIRHNINTDNYAAGLSTYFAEVNVDKTSFVENEHYTASYGRGGGGGGFNIAGGAALFQSDVTITDSTFSGNKSFYGGGLIVSSDSPISLASKSSRFGESSNRGIINSDLQLTNSTITNNQALIGSGLLDIGSDATITLQGSIVSGNENLIYDIYGPEIYSIGESTFNLDANNIIGDKGESGTTGITLGASDQSFNDYAEDNLYPLTLSNGQLMHPLKVGSIAIDGNNPSCFGSVSDQEGKGRGIDGDSNGSFICDVGSFEHSMVITANGSPCTFVNALASAENDSSIGGCQPGNGHDIIVLPENSIQTFENIVDQAEGYANYFGISGIDSAVTIESNGSKFQRNLAATEDFDLFLVNTGGQLNLIDATVTGANGGMGAVTTWYGGNINLINSKVTENQSTGVFDIFSINSSVVNSEISQNSYLPSSISASFSPLTTLQSVGFELKQSTISGNNGGAGGGVDFRNVTLASMENSTVSGNNGYYSGGVIMTSSYSANFSSAKVNNSTITGNTGSFAGGLYAVAANPNSMSIFHSIISGNELSTPPTITLDRSGSINHLLGTPVLAERGVPTSANEIYSSTPYLALNNFNIIGQNSISGTVGVSPGVSDIVPAGATNTVIETTLADNGGATLTHLPVDGGDAVDSGDDFCGTREDQTGRIRPWDGDGDGDENCDIGAVERGSIYASDIIFKDGFDAEIFIRRAPIND